MGYKNNDDNDYDGDENFSKEIENIYYFWDAHEYEISRQKTE